jgi:hypothetical protein
MLEFKRATEGLRQKEINARWQLLERALATLDEFIHAKAVDEKRTWFSVQKLYSPDELVGDLSLPTQAEIALRLARLRERQRKGSRCGTVGRLWRWSRRGVVGGDSAAVETRPGA